MPRNLALTFEGFINEDAYVDPKGQLQDFEFTPDEEYEIDSYDDIVKITDFLEDAGAKVVDHRLREQYLTFFFKYASEPYVFRIDLDHNTALIARVESKEKKHTIYDGNAESLFDLIGSTGLSFLQGY